MPDTIQPDDPMKLVGEVEWRELPLDDLLRLIRKMFKELVPTEAGDVTRAHHARATLLRLALCEALERAGRIYPVPPLVCTCGEVCTTIDEMDVHLWEAFVPTNDIGLDGKMHGELDRTL